MKKIILILATITLVLSCNNKKGAAKTAEKGVENKRVVEKEEALEELTEKGKKRFVVSFYSPGNGIDHVVKKEYDQFLAKEYSNLEVHQKSWGREGEIDYCINIEELSNKNRLLFISKSEEILKTSVKVRYNGSDSCEN